LLWKARPRFDPEFKNQVPFPTASAVSVLVMRYPKKGGASDAGALKANQIGRHVAMIGLSSRR
jgi:hypothetical protein